MMKMEPPQRLLSSPRKFLQSQRFLTTFAIFFLIFGCGLGFGITLSFCFESNPFNLKLVEQLFATTSLGYRAPPNLPVEESQHLSINETSNFSTGISSNSSYDEPSNFSMEKPTHPFTNKQKTQSNDEPPNLFIDKQNNHFIDEPPNLLVDKQRTNDPQFQPNNKQYDSPFDEPPNLPINKPLNSSIDKPPNPVDEPEKENAIDIQDNKDFSSNPNPNPSSGQENVKKEGNQENIQHETIPNGETENVLSKPNPHLQSQPLLQPQPQVQPQSKSQLEPNSLPQLQPQQESQPMQQSQLEQQPKPQPFQQLQLEPQQNPESLQQPQLQPQPKPQLEPKPLSQPQPLPQSELQPQQKPQPFQQLQLEPQQKPEPLQHPQLELKPKPQLQPQLQLPSDTHKMKDNELFNIALRTPNIPKDSPIPDRKVAFMFLVRGVLPLAPLWDKFFKGHEGLYSIYVHTQSSFKGEVAQESIFHGRRIKSKKVEWGKISMVEAERRLLANALLDTSNERFVLLSEACIPLYNFTTLHSYLMGSTQTFVEAYDSPGPVGQGRYNSGMRPTVKLQQWRKGSQWFEVDRFLAQEIISDRKYFSLFRRYCKPPCYSDEHYIPTYISIKYWKMNANRTLHWVDWSKGGPHPSKFEREDVTPEFLNGMRYGTECLYNGKASNTCFMFARKFSPNALSRLLELAPQVLYFNY